MFILKVLLVCTFTQFWFLAVISQYSYDCDEHFCSKIVPCPEVNCRNGSRLIKNATQCGCCHVCVEQLKEGDKCKTHELAVIPRQECGAGLKCELNHKKEATCVVSKDTPCIKNRRGSQPTEAECDEFGFFKSKVCVSETLCYCVNKVGNRVFGTDVASKRDSMNCNCARDYDKFPRDISNGNFLRCLRNGNYDSLQCTEKYCYCMGQDYHIVGTVLKANTTIKDLLCYDKRIHRDDDAMQRSKCWHQRNSLLRQIKNYEMKGIRVIGADLPLCDLDGSYAPVQCKKDSCYCVKQNGESYGSNDYKVKRNSKDAKNMTCRCVRDHEMLMNMKNVEKVKTYLKNNPCDHKGDYAKNKS